LVIFLCVRFVKQSNPTQPPNLDQLENSSNVLELSLFVLYSRISVLSLFDGMARNGD